MQVVAGLVFSKPKTLDKLFEETKPMKLLFFTLQNKWAVAPQNFPSNGQRNETMGDQRYNERLS